MAKVLAPLFSIEVSGSLKGGPCFKRWRKLNVAGKIPSPPGRITEPNFLKAGEAIVAWESLTEEERNTWRTWADRRKGPPIWRGMGLQSGWALFLSMFVWSWAAGENWPRLPPKTNEPGFVKGFGLVYNEQAEQMELTWNVSQEAKYIFIEAARAKRQTRKLFSQDFVNVAVVEASDGGYIEEDIVGGKKYGYAVTLIRACGQKGRSISLEAMS